MENNGHFENKVLECAVPKSVAKRINAMLIDEKGNLKPIPPLKINGSEGN
jgi:hypothetical protein